MCQNLASKHAFQWTAVLQPGFPAEACKRTLALLISWPHIWTACSDPFLTLCSNRLTSGLAPDFLFLALSLLSDLTPDTVFLARTLVPNSPRSPHHGSDIPAPMSFQRLRLVPGQRENSGLQKMFLSPLFRQSDIFGVWSNGDGRKMSHLAKVIHVLSHLSPHIWEPL